MSWKLSDEEFNHLRDLINQLERSTYPHGSSKSRQLAHEANHILEWEAIYLKDRNDKREKK